MKEYAARRKNRFRYAEVSCFKEGDTSRLVADSKKIISKSYDPYGSRVRAKCLALTSFRIPDTYRLIFASRDYESPISAE
jgi:hypothetical protein